MALGANYEAESPAAAILFSALDDPFWSLRRYAVNNLSKVATSTVKEQLKSKLYTLIISDPVAGVRQAAIKAVLKYFPEGDHSIVLKKAVSDSSYSVSGEALSAFTEKNKEEGLLIAKKIEDLSVRTSREQLFSLYSKYGSDDQFDFMNDAYARTSGYDRYYSLELYSNYLKRCNTKPALNQGLTTIADQAKSDELWLSRMAAYKELLVLKKYFTDKENSYADFNSLKLKADEYINDIKSSEKDSRVKKSFDSN